MNRIPTDPLANYRRAHARLMAFLAFACRLQASLAALFLIGILTGLIP